MKNIIRYTGSIVLAFLVTIPAITQANQNAASRKKVRIQYEFMPNEHALDMIILNPENLPLIKRKDIKADVYSARPKFQSGAPGPLLLAIKATALFEDITVDTRTPWPAHRAEISLIRRATITAGEATPWSTVIPLLQKAFRNTLNVEVEEVWPRLLFVNEYNEHFAPRLTCCPNPSNAASLVATKHFRLTARFSGDKTKLTLMLPPADRGEIMLTEWEYSIKRGGLYGRASTLALTLFEDTRTVQVREVAVNQADLTVSFVRAVADIEEQMRVIHEAQVLLAKLFKVAIILPSN